MMPDNRSPLMKRLAEIMPKKPETPQFHNKLAMHIELHPIRQAADSFASWMGDELPANDEELIAMLWVFGEILNGEMERMLNYYNQRNVDLLNTLPITPSMVHLSEIGEVTKEQMESLAPLPPNYTLKFDHFSIPKYNRENAIASVTATITDDVRYILDTAKKKEMAVIGWKKITPKTKFEIGKRYLIYSESSAHGAMYQDGTFNVIRWQERSEYLIQGWTHFLPINPPQNEAIDGPKG